MLCYPHICRILKRTAAGPVGDLGTKAYSWAEVQTTPCEFTALSAGEIARITAAGESAQDRRVVNLPPTVQVIPFENRIVTTQTGYAGTYEIEEIRPAPGLYGRIHHYEISIREVVV